MKTPNAICLHSLVKSLETKLADAKACKQFDIAETLQGCIDIVMESHHMRRCEFCASPEEQEFLASHDFGNLCETCERDWVGEIEHKRELTMVLRREGNGLN